MTLTIHRDGEEITNHSLTPLDLALWSSEETGPEDAEGRPTQFTHTATVSGQVVTIIEAIAYDAHGNDTRTFTQDKPEREVWQYAPTLKPDNTPLKYTWTRIE